MSSPTRPSLDHVFTIEADIAAPKSSGPGPMGERLHIPITGGRVHGLRLTGRILPGGSDWALVGPDGYSRVDARYTIQADDEALIYVHNQGIRVSSPDVAARMRSGEVMPPESYYFRAVPRFDVGDGPHQWLRDSIFVCSLMPQGRSIVIDVFRVE